MGFCSFGWLEHAFDSETATDLRADAELRGHGLRTQNADFPVSVTDQHPKIVSKMKKTSIKCPACPRSISVGGQS